MATKFSAFTAGSTPADSDTVVGVQGGNNAKWIWSQIKAYLGLGSTTQTTINGTTAGSAVCSQPAVGSAYKKVVVYLSGYENTGATAQTYAFPTAFTNAPAFSLNSDPPASATASTLTLPANMTGTCTGWIVLEGY